MRPYWLLALVVPTWLGGCVQAKVGPPTGEGEASAGALQIVRTDAGLATLESRVLESFLQTWPQGYPIELGATQVLLANGSSEVAFVPPVDVALSLHDVVLEPAGVAATLRVDVAFEPTTLDVAVGTSGPYAPGCTVHLDIGPIQARFSLAHSGDKVGGEELVVTSSDPAVVPVEAAAPRCGGAAPAVAQAVGSRIALGLREALTSSFPLDALGVLRAQLALGATRRVQWSVGSPLDPTAGWLAVEVRLPPSAADSGARTKGSGDSTGGVGFSFDVSISAQAHPCAPPPEATSTAVFPPLAPPPRGAALSAPHETLALSAEAVRAWIEALFQAGMLCAPRIAPAETLHRLRATIPSLKALSDGTPLEFRVRPRSMPTVKARQGALANEAHQEPLVTASFDAAVDVYGVLDGARTRLWTLSATWRAALGIHVAADGAVSLLVTGVDVATPLFSSPVFVQVPPDGSSAATTLARLAGEALLSGRSVAVVPLPPGASVDAWSAQVDGDVIRVAVQWRF